MSVWHLLRFHLQIRTHVTTKQRSVMILGVFLLFKAAVHMILCLKKELGLLSQSTKKVKV